MSRIRGADTGPEVLVRSMLHRAGYRFRKNVKDLPGTPDIVLPKYKTVIFVHGCFWHRHKGCKDATTPKSNIEFWEKKFERNIENDKKTRTPAPKTRLARHHRLGMSAQETGTCFPKAGKTANH